MGNPPVAPSDPSPTPKLIPAANEPTERPVPAFAFDGESQELPVFDSQSDTTPYRIQPPPDMILSKAQQLIALGNWEEGLADLLKLEELNPGLHGLFETNSGFFTRFLVENIETGEKGLLKAEKLIQHLKESGVERYNTVIFDEFLAESKEASEERNYQRATIYLKFALEIYPTDTRAKNLFDLNQMYLELKKPGLNSAEMLSIAQRLYARDPDFGAIQDDLAAIYMQLGDEAGKAGYEEEAISWYSLIAPLNPKDTRLVSLASHKQRAIEDDRKRRGLDPRPQATAASSPPKRTPLAEPNRQENETIIRLRERVSRVQKAWDGGRKEVGAEYIDLVEQLTAQLNPNPWLTTFPRVCYDYGKWLYDQKQYLEARPYFVKAQQLGMAAAQQRINEIDRLTQDRAGDKRAKPGVFDDPAKPAVTQPPLNPSVFDDDFFGEIKKPASSPSPTAVAPTDYAIPTTPPVSSAFGSIGNSYAPTPRNSKEAAFVKNSKSDKPEKLVGVSGTLRNPVLPVDPLQTAASREASRLGGTSIPNNARGDNSFVPIKLRRTMPGWILPAFFGLLILVALVFVGLNMSNQNATQAVVSPTANPALTITPSVATTPIVVSGGQVSAKVSGIKPEEFQVFLAVAGESPANWREMIVDSNGNWLLSTGVANRLDPAVKYAVIVRPRNTETRKYQQDLPLNAPLQTIFARNNLNYNPRDGLSVDMKIEPQAIHFYPLAGTEDQALTNGRYFGATRHFVSTAFFNFYNQGGNIGRFGFPISEEFDLEGVGRVQFFERGWLVQNPTDKLVKIGRVSPDVLALPPTCSFFPRPTAPAGSNVRTDAAFTTFVNGNPNVGAPLSAAFEVTEISGGKKKVQYFEFARLETNADGKPGVNLGLLGTEFARCKDWFRT
jgi:tetratricopeptide (TPR) repeat protein